MSEAVDGLPYLAALVLAAAFAIAAIAKWRDRPGTARAFRALGVPRPWTSARLVPGVEATLAVGLVVTPSGAAGVALALLVAFTVFLVGRLRAGVHAPCSCFGGWGTGSLGPADVVRNGWLLLAALVALGGARPEVPTPLAVVAALLCLTAAVVSIRLVGGRERAPGT